MSIVNKSTFITFKAPKQLKRVIEGIAYERKINDKPKATIKDVTTELLKAALELPKYQQYSNLNE